jgi:hypothetical protein
MIDALPLSFGPPSLEVSLRGGERRKILGSMRHWQPVCAMEKIAFTTSRRLLSRGRPDVAGDGMHGSITAHSASVVSLA